jgi:hypothetical protein
MQRIIRGNEFVSLIPCGIDVGSPFFLAEMLVGTGLAGTPVGCL